MTLVQQIDALLTVQFRSTFCLPATLCDIAFRRHRTSDGPPKHRDALKLVGMSSTGVYLVWVWPWHIDPGEGRVHVQFHPLRPK